MDLFCCSGMLLPCGLGVSRHSLPEQYFVTIMLIFFFPLPSYWTAATSLGLFHCLDSSPLLLTVNKVLPHHLAFLSFCVLHSFFQMFAKRSYAKAHDD